MERCDLAPTPLVLAEKLGRKKARKNLKGGRCPIEPANYAGSFLAGRKWCQRKALFGLDFFHFFGVDHLFEMGFGSNHKNVIDYTLQIISKEMTSLKLTANAPENGWLEDDVSFCESPRGYLETKWFAKRSTCENPDLLGSKKASPLKRSDSCCFFLLMFWDL